METAHSKRRRISRFLSAIPCFAAAVLLTLSLITGAVLLQIINTDRFHHALQNHVSWESLGIPPENLHAFARETIGYLKNDFSQWKPEVLTAEGTLYISPGFSSHMETVKLGVNGAFRIACLLFSAGIVLLAVHLLIRSGGFSVKGYLMGIALPFLMIAVVFAAAISNFTEFWYWLHTHFIPDGIFSAYEPVMKLFPASLFSSYIFPLLLTLAAVIVLLLLPPVLYKMMIRKRSNQ